MAKKNKKLKKKKTSFPTTQPATDQSSISQVVVDHTTISPSGAAAISTPAPKVEDSPEFGHVKRDVKKILFLLGVIVLLLIGLYVLDLKTSYLSSVADWIYKILNIQTQ